jgi:hypothetical protein
MEKIRVADWKDLEPLHPAYAPVANVDLVVIRWQDEELASARFGYSMDKVRGCQAFHFKCGQGAKTGTGSHLCQFLVDDLTTWKGEMAHLTGVA